MGESKQLVIDLDRKPKRNHSTRILFRTIPGDVADKARMLDVDDTVIIKDPDGLESVFTIISKTKLSLTVKSQRDLEEDESVQDREIPAGDLAKSVVGNDDDAKSNDDDHVPNDVSGKIIEESAPAISVYDEGDEEEHHGLRDRLEDLDDIMYDHLPSPLQTAYGFIHRNASELPGRVKRMFQRVRRGYDDYDVWNLGDREIDRLSSLMLELARTDHGYPPLYIQDDGDANIHNGRRYWLNKHDDDYEEWLKTPWNRFSIVSIDWSKIGSTKDFNHKLNETVEEYGADGAAWIQDLYYASRVFRRYSLLNDTALEDYEDRTLGIVGDNGDDKRIESEFKRVWAWMGEVLPYMWD
jgi:hypothetical protein